MTQNEMAKALGLTKGTVSLYHKRGMPLDSVLAANRWRIANTKPRKAEPLGPLAGDSSTSPIKPMRPIKPLPPVDYAEEAETARSMRESLQWARQAERWANERLLRAAAKPLRGESNS